MNFEWIEIPSGTFRMGTSEKEVQELIANHGLLDFRLESPQQQIYIDTFEISKYPVTHAQYKAFLEATGYPGGVSPYFAAYIFNKDDTLADHPIGWISWYDALAFCQWAGCRLPTEAEWEKAARGPSGFRYPWGDTWHEGHCNSLESGNDISTSVGRYQEGLSPYGVADMAGNVWEWTDGWITINLLESNLPDSKRTNEQLFHHLPILKGGGVGSNYAFVRCAFRFIKYQPYEWGDWVGFRCVKLRRR